MANLPSPPFIPVEGIHNFRDIGGTPIYFTVNVAPTVLFRSADPSRATEAGLLKLKELGITHVFDLRSRVEIERDAWDSGRSADPEAEPEVFKRIGIKRYWTPVFAEDDYAPEKIALRYRQYAREGTEVCKLFCTYYSIAESRINGYVGTHSSELCYLAIVLFTEFL